MTAAATARSSRAAAGRAPGQAGAAPQANLVSLDVMDDSGMALTSDVIAAAEWIYQNRVQYNIRVANFSLHSVTPSNFTRDPLDRAVEKLWFSGVTVVVASGNYGSPTGPSGVKFAPGNAALNRCLKPDPLNTGPLVFDGVIWSDAAKSSVSWDSASWSDASWSDSALQAVSRSDVSWTDVSWTDVSWTDVSWSDVAAAADVSWEDAAGSEGDDPPVGGDYELTPEEAAAAEADPLLNPPTLQIP